MMAKGRRSKSTTPWGMRARGSRHGLAAGVLALIAAGLFADGTPASAQLLPPQSAQNTLNYNIAAQDLNAALLSFADRAGLQLAYDADLVEGLRSAPLNGGFTPADGLTRLLAGTGLGFQFSSANSVTLQRVTPHNSGPVELGAIRVQGDKVGRTTAEITPGTTVIDGARAEQPNYSTTLSVIREVPNVLAEEGIQLPSIRGIDGTAGLRQGFTAGTQPRVPILIDGVARPLSNSFSISQSSTWDTSTVEVARGPQPTSTGRNALAGAIRIFTNDPTFTYEAAGRLGGRTEDGTIEGAGMVNVPILADQLALRATIEERRGESYVDVIDPTDFGRDPADEVFRRYRGKLRFVPDALPGLDAQLTIDHIRTEGPIPGFLDGDPDDLTISDFAIRSSIEENDQTTYVATASYEVSDRLSFDARASLIDNEVSFPLSVFTIEQREIEGEAFVQFADIGFIDRGVVGVIHNEATEDSEAEASVADGEISNTGIYAEVEVGLDAIGLTEQLTLIAGGRFEIDDRRRSVLIENETISDLSFTERRFLPKLGLRYAPTDDLSLGYTYTESFRPGGAEVDLFASFFGLPLTNVAEFGPETLRQHEIFARATLWNDRIDIGTSAFYYTYEDAQVPGAATLPSVLGGNLFGNIPQARGLGFEVDATIAVTDQVTVTAGLGLLDTEITDAGPILADLDGEELPRAPNVTANLGLLYQSDFGLDASARLRFIGETTSGLSQPTIDRYSVIDLAAGYEFELGMTTLRIDAFIENVADERYFTFRERREAGFAFDAVGRPRTFGLAGTVRF